MSYIEYMHRCAYGGASMYPLVKAIKALSDETRLRILNVLAERECCVCEVVQALEISQTRASRNLSMLFDVGFLKMRKEGLWSIYSLDRNDMPEYLMKLVEAVESALVQNKTAALDKERLKKAERSGIKCVNRSGDQSDKSATLCSKK
jgi:ArsR family transcriptional regulator, arsenate/arsenite/antimonite-responsive transcriptional repressor